MDKYFMYILLSIICLIVLIVIIILISPFQYPYYEKKLDVSGKRNPNLEKMIENFINEGGFDEIFNHQEKIKAWKEECEIKIQHSVFTNLRKEQYERCLDDNNAYHFYLIRMQTRYKQQNYQKTSYKVEQVIAEGQYNYRYLYNRYKMLKALDFEITLQDYQSKQQRKLMTKQLREQIVQRDNYTCQICGKYMYDGVGLQIDHIIPIAKGGKTIPSNLQVLCSKCNGKKSSKF